MSMWRFTLSFLLNVASQRVHLYGFSPRKHKHTAGIKIRDRIRVKTQLENREQSKNGGKGQIYFTSDLSGCGCAVWGSVQSWKPSCRSGTWTSHQCREWGGGVWSISRMEKPVGWTGKWFLTTFRNSWLTREMTSLSINRYGRVKKTKTDSQMPQ